MAVETVQVDVHICDGCGNEQVQFPDFDVPNGFHGGQIAHITNIGGHGVGTWFACREACIKKAVVNALARNA